MLIGFRALMVTVWAAILRLRNNFPESIQGFRLVDRADSRYTISIGVKVISLLAFCDSRVHTDIEYDCRRATK